MNLFELKKEKRDAESDYNYYKNEVERLRIKVGIHATDYSKDKISSSHGNGQEEAILQLTQMEMDLDDAIKKLNNVNKLVSDKYNIYRQYNDYDKQIYTEKKLFKWSNAKISARHNNISKWAINRICKKIENNK